MKVTSHEEKVSHEGIDHALGTPRWTWIGEASLCANRQDRQSHSTSRGRKEWIRD